MRESFFFATEQCKRVGEHAESTEAEFMNVQFR